MNIVRQYITRVSNPTPLFFRKVRRIGLAISGAGTAGLMHHNTHVQTIATNAIVVGAAIAAVASAAQTDKTDTNETTVKP